MIGRVAGCVLAAVEVGGADASCTGLVVTIAPGRSTGNAMPVRWWHSAPPQLRFSFDFSCEWH
jgi:hypothetical protein